MYGVLPMTYVTLEYRLSLYDARED